MLKWILFVGIGVLFLLVSTPGYSDVGLIGPNGEALVFLSRPRTRRSNSC